MSIDDLFTELQGKDSFVEEPEEDEFEKSCKNLAIAAEKYGTFICLPDTSNGILQHRAIRLEDTTDQDIETWVKVFCPHLNISQPIKDVSREGIFALVVLKNSALHIPINK